MFLTSLLRPSFLLPAACAALIGFSTAEQVHAQETSAQNSAPGAEGETIMLKDLMEGSWGFIGNKKPESSEAGFAAGATACKDNLPAGAPQGLPPLPAGSKGHLVIFTTPEKAHVAWVKQGSLNGNTYTRTGVNNQNDVPVVVMGNGDKPDLALIPRVLSNNDKPHPILAVKINPNVNGPAEGLYVKCLP